MTNAQERAKALWLSLQAQSSVDTHQIKILVDFAAQVEAETLRVYREHIARNLGLDHNLMFQRSFTKREIINALDEAEIVMDGQQAQRAKEGKG